MSRESPGARACGRLLALLIVCIGMSGNVARTSASPLAQASLPSSAAPLSSCMGASIMDEWRADLTFSYDQSAAEHERQRRAVHRQSGTISLQFGNRIVGDEHDPRIKWFVTEVVTSSMRFFDRLTQTNPDGSATWTQRAGEGASISSIGVLALHPQTCIYDFWLAAMIDGSATSSDGPPQSITLRPLALAIPARSFTQFPMAWSGNIPVAMEPAQHADNFGTDDSTVMEILRSQGATTAGAASVSWNIVPLSPLPSLNEVHLQHLAVATTEWVALPATGTTDGNWIRVTATVENPLDTVFPVHVRFLDGETGALLYHHNVTLGPNSTEVVEYLLDTQGWAWDDRTTPASPHPNRRVRVEFGTTQGLFGEIEKPFRVRPKPVVLVHGLNSNASTWNSYPGFLQAVYPGWQSHAVHTLRTGHDVAAPQPSDTIVGNAQALHESIEWLRRTENAWSVDIVAHSLGGLISRQYVRSFMPRAHRQVVQLQEFRYEDQDPLVTHLVMLGTPNQGSLCAIPYTIITTLTGGPNINALRELLPESVAAFNERVPLISPVRFSVLAGNSWAFTCDPTLPWQRGDSVVSVQSAHYAFTDVGLTATVHTDMTASQTDFTSWVLPRLAVGRESQVQSAPTADTPATVRQTAPPLQITHVLSQTVAAGATVNLPFDSAGATGLGAATLGAAGVRIALLDPAGETIAVDERPTQELRSLAVAAPVTGTWTLRVQNTRAAPADVLAVVLQTGTPLVATAQVGVPDAHRRLPITAHLTHAGSPVSDASATATLVTGDGVRQTVTLHDDGLHGDGAAGDGRYGGLSATVAPGGAAVLVQFTRGNQMRLVVTSTLAATASTPADLDGNGTVDVADVQLVAGQWNRRAQSPGWDPRYDLDQDGDVDIVDIMSVAGAWG